MRGHPKDYDAWAAQFDLPGWSFDQCLPYFKKCETSDRVDAGGSAFRGGSGRLSVTKGESATLLLCLMFIQCSASLSKSVQFWNLCPPYTHRNSH